MLPSFHSLPLASQECSAAPIPYYHRHCRLPITTSAVITVVASAVVNVATVAALHGSSHRQRYVTRMICLNLLVFAICALLLNDVYGRNWLKIVLNA